MNINLANLRVFCIGMPRTGTLSLVKAARMLGLYAAHFDESFYNNKLGEVSVMSDKFIHEDGYDNFNLFADFPFAFPVIWKGLYEYYENSLFIYTYRDIEKWISSFKRLPSMPGNGEYHRLHRAYRKKMFLYDHCSIETDNLYRKAFREHEENVYSFFPDIETNRRVLIWDITTKPDWSILCNFLGINTPDNIRFPHSNKASRGIQ